MWCCQHVRLLSTPIVLLIAVRGYAQTTPRFLRARTCGRDAQSSASLFTLTRVQARTQGGFEGVRMNPIFGWVYWGDSRSTTGLVRRTVAREPRLLAYNHIARHLVLLGSHVADRYLVRSMERCICSAYFTRVAGSIILPLYTANKTTPRMPQNAPQTVLNFKIFLGEHAPRPPYVAALPYNYTRLRRVCLSQQCM